uniref:RHS repeat-associated core domain-containing protein n=1 Tax=Pseudomonas sp. RL_105y_Pfl2_101 TaxID=3088708 RepID=UPI0030D92CD2
MQWFYDRAGNNTREHQYLRYLQEPHVAVWKHEYDALNQRIATTRPDGHRVSWLTYGSGHLLALKVDDQELLSYQRDNLHREIARDQGNGLQQRQAWTPNGQLQEQALGKRGDAQRLVVRNYRHDAAGQLTRIDDTRRGALSYRYDPLGRLLAAQTISGEETFAFDPASNLLDPQAPRRPNQYVPNKLLDNLLRDYVGTHYSYDERGNLKERLHNGKKSPFTWDLYDRLIGYADDRLTVSFAYDALGRRLFKLSKAKYHDRREAGPMWNKLERAKLDEQYGCGYTIYGWDGDVLAFESRNNDKSERLTHYFFEPGSFVPVAQAVEQRSIQLLPQPVYEGAYDIDRDPVWQHKPKPVSFNAVAWYQCDHLGTPMELTDEHGDIAWAGVYKAWGLAKEQRSETAKRTDIRNPLRFQGQYFDVETGLHYNRYRYYDPQAGRFIGKDPIGFLGGLNVHHYASNPINWVDPIGLTACTPCHDKTKCKVLLSKIYAKALGRKEITGNRGLLERIEDLQEDKYNLYGFAPTMDKARSYGALAGKGSWEGHVKAANDLKAGLNNDIRNFNEGGCNKHYKIPSSASRAASLAIPTRPTR